MLLEELRKAAEREEHIQTIIFFSGLALFASGVYVLVRSATEIGFAEGKISLIDRVKDLNE